eukprot:scaffold15084_cov21-Tisochrysis_lutea.AAC.1
MANPPLFYSSCLNWNSAVFASHTHAQSSACAVPRSALKWNTFYYSFHHLAPHCNECDCINPFSALHCESKPVSRNSQHVCGCLEPQGGHQPSDLQGKAHLQRHLGG